MSDRTSIEWTATVQPDGTVTKGSTWNPIRGQNARHTCARISPGCTNCYADTMTKRGLMGTAPIGYGTGETLNDPALLNEAVLLQPFSWRKPRKVFVCSMTDLFGTWVPDEWIDRIFGVMALTPQHTYIVLTKRPTRMRDWATRGDPLEDRATLVSREAGHIGGVVWDSRGSDEWKYSDVAGMPGKAGSKERAEHLAKRRVWPGWPLPNVWMMTTIESDAFTWRADRLRQTPAAVRGISAEPLLSGLPSLDLTGIDWLITGGESGAKARPCHPNWVRDLRDRSAANGTAFFHKQWGEWAPADWLDLTATLGMRSDSGHITTLARGGERIGALPIWSAIKRVGRVQAGRELDGRTWDDFPQTAAVAGAR